MCSRLTKNRKNVCYSMMADYRRRAYVTQMRTLYPEHLKAGRKNQRYSEIFVGNPDYLSRETRCVAKDADSVVSDLDEDEVVMLVAFLEDNDCMVDEDVVDELQYYLRVKLNGISIITVAREERKGTCDSIVCGRYIVRDEEVNVPVGVEPEETETIFLGQVQHAVKFRDANLLCVEWYKVGALDDDQLAGLSVIPVSVREQQDQMWIDVDSIIIQQHILLRPDIRSRSFHVVIKI